MDSVIFEDNRGFAWGHNPHAVQPFATWQFTAEENGAKDYYWGHYSTDAEKTRQDFETRTVERKDRYGLNEPVSENYKYYSTQRPVDIGTFPKTESEPVSIVNFDKREAVEGGNFEAWGFVAYKAPLSEKQIADYELREARNNPDCLRLSISERERRAQVVGKWEQAKRIPDASRRTWKHINADFFEKKEFVTDAQLTERYNKVIKHKSRDGTKSIADQLAEGKEQAEKDNASRPAPDGKTEKNR